MLSAISSAKNELVDVDAYVQTAHDFYTKKIAQLYRKYQDILRKSSALDFDDLLLYGVELIRKHADVAAELRPGTPAQFGAFIRAEIVKWAKVVTASGARVDN